MTFLAILGLVATITLIPVTAFFGLVAFIQAAEDADAYAVWVWVVMSVLAITFLALSIWQPLHWAGIA